MTYNVRIKLKTSNIFDIDTRVEEVKEIKEWIDAVTHWQPEQYDWKYLSSTAELDVWFKDERSATMCRLRWTA